MECSVHHHDRRRLPSSDIPAFSLGGLQRPQQPFHERRSIGQPFFVGSGHGRPARVIAQQVALHGEAVTHQVACGGNGFAAGVRRGPALRVGIRLGKDTSQISLAENRFAGLMKDVDDLRGK